MPTTIPGLADTDQRLAGQIFEYVQFLLDEDSNLTPMGNMTSAARGLLKKRVDEILETDEGGGTQNELPAEAP
jgi:hypothetical protein